MARTDLSPLQPDDVASLEAMCRVQQVPAGTRLIAAGSEVETIYVVRSGEVELSSRRALGGRQLVALVRAGDVLADIPMFCERRMPFDARTGADSTIIELDRDELVDLLQRSPSLSLRWATSVAKRLEQTQRRMVTVLTKDLRAQVATVLLEEREPEPGGQWVVRLTHATLAELLGARRQSVSRVVAKLRKSGLVATRYRSMYLQDLDALADVAGVSLEEIVCGAEGAALPGSSSQLTR
jgi:CRP-like cAMP-binding protein